MEARKRMQDNPITVVQVTVKYPNNIGYCIKKYGFTNTELADEVGITRRTLSNYIAGTRSVPRGCLEKIAATLGCSIEELRLPIASKDDADVSLANYNNKRHSQQAGPISANFFARDLFDMQSARFLTMGSEELIERYANERQRLLELHTDQRDWVLPQVVIFDNTYWRFPITAIEIQPDRTRPNYAIPAAIEGKTKDLLDEIGDHFYDSATIRLNRIEKYESDLRLIVSSARYLDYLVTNYSMDALLKDHGWTRSLRDIVHPSAQLCSLETSLLANHIGVGVLIFTADGFLVIPVRSKEKVGIWQGEISPSISGAARYDDDMWRAQPAHISSWMREGREELGLSNADFDEDSEVFLGITRELLRGGKPEMFFAARVHLTKADVMQKFSRAKDRWENSELLFFEFTNSLTPPTTEQEQAVFIQQFERFIAMYEHLLSQPAQANLALWFNYMMSPAPSGA